MSASLTGHLRSAIRATEQANLYRKRRVIEGGHGALIEVDGQRCINFCSNDYLGLASEPAMGHALARAAEKLGSGSGASQLITGYNAEHRALEASLAEFLGRERALLFGNGFTANLGVISALMGKGDHIVSDSLNHASLIDGARLSGAAKRIYAHADIGAARAQLAECQTGNKLLVSDGVFSMDGDIAPLAELAALAKANDAWLMVDDAHGFGVLGPEGQGAVAAAGLTADDVPIQVATLGKSIGVAGAFVVGDNDLIEYLIQKARPFIFSTAMPPALASAARTGLGILQTQPWRRDKLHRLIAHLQAGARQLGLPISASSTPIQPLILGEERHTLAVSQKLLQHGFLVSAIRPPTVPAGSARLRITLSAAHDFEQVDALLHALSEILTPSAAVSSA